MVNPEDPQADGAGVTTEMLDFEHFSVVVRDGKPLELGRGAMGITYKALDKNLQAPVALKVINGGELGFRNARERFMREARAAAALRHPNVATVFHLGEQSGNIFYAMEFVEGETVEARIRREGAMDPKLALQVVAQVASAFTAAEKQGLVHRDIKPSNIMLANGEPDEIQVKVIDFGLAKSVVRDASDATQTLTQAGFLGTPHFASPEQLQEQEIDIRSDIYSLGVTLFYMLSGHTPFSGSIAQVMSQHLYKEPPIDQLDGQNPAVIELLTRLLEKDPEKRAQNGQDVRSLVEEALRALTGGDTAPVEEMIFSVGATLVRRFELLEQLENVAGCRRFRATDRKTENELVEVIALDGKFSDGFEAWLTGLQRVNVGAMHQIRYVNFRGSTPVVVLEQLDGTTLLRVLKARRSLPLPEALLVLGPLAEVSDGLHAAGLMAPRFALHGIQLMPAEAPATPLDTWPELKTKFEVLNLDDWSLSPGGGTVIRSSPVPSAPSGSRAGGPAFTLAALAYEILGGSRFDSRHAQWTPLAELSQAANQVIRRALEPDGFASAAEFFAALSGNAPIPPASPHPSTRTPSTSYRSAVPASTPPPPVSPPSSALPPPPIPPTPVPADLQTPPPVPAKRGFPTALVVSLAVLILIALGVGGFLFFRSSSDAEVVKPPVDVTPKVVSEPTSTPPPTDTVNEAQAKSAEAYAAAKALEDAFETAPALLAYAKLATAHPNDSSLGGTMERLAAKIESDNGSEIDPAKFKTLRPALEAAAAHDVTTAQFLLGENLFNSEPRVALEYLLGASQRGRSDAMARAGWMLSIGRGVDQPDFKNAVKWFEEAAKRNHPYAMTLLADSYLRGLGVDETDPEKAVELLTAASALGEDRAMDLLGNLYRKGIGVPEVDFDEAFELFQQAAQMGNLDAQGNLGVMIIMGEGTEPSAEKAVELWKDGAEKGNAACMFFYAVTLEDPNISNNRAEAEIWYAKAARAGDNRAMNWCRENDVDWTSTDE